MAARYIYVMKKEWIKAIIILPFNVTVVIPVLILYFFEFKYSAPPAWVIISGTVLLVIGLAMAVSTMLLFNNIGKGTAAPWAPPRNLVITGPYKYVRNPMITAVLSILLAESFLLNSTALGLWFVLFFLINSIYIPQVEEKQLIKRFGEEYLEYMRKVPRWIPNRFL